MDKWIFGYSFPMSSMITWTTVGYGDIALGTQSGRILTLIVAFRGAVMISFVVLMVSNAFNLTEM